MSELSTCSFYFVIKVEHFSCYHCVCDFTTCLAACVIVQLFACMLVQLSAVSLSTCQHVTSSAVMCTSFFIADGDQGSTWVLHLCLAALFTCLGLASLFIYYTFRYSMHVWTVWSAAVPSAYTRPARVHLLDTDDLHHAWVHLLNTHVCTWPLASSTR